jgi:23S rRNA (cytosine1962-C5)-methyltransferase
MSAEASTPLPVPLFQVNWRAAVRLRAGHPWVYRSDLLDPAAPTPRGAMVHLADERGKLLGSALSSSSSQIALRMLDFQSRLSEADLVLLLRQRIQQAIAYRKRFVHGTNAFRLVFSEADQLPGLIIDRYADVLTFHVLTQAMDRADVRDAVIDSLIASFDAELPSINIVERAEPRIRELEELEPVESRLVVGEKTFTPVVMNGLTFQVEALAGQKTGAFLDQRENYVAAAKYAYGEALDVFCYQGGFALHLGRVCDSLIGVDISRAALEQAEANAAANQSQLRCGEIEWLEANAFDLLKDYAASGKQYDTIVLDPPAFAKNRRSLDKALSGYKEINLRALKMLRPGGILVTNSCSHHISEVEFLGVLAEAAVDAGKTLKVLERRTQALDHPILLAVPETHYLKCVICTTT